MRDEDQLKAPLSQARRADTQWGQSVHGCFSLPLAVAASRQLCSVLQALAQSVSCPSHSCDLSVSPSAGAAESSDEAPACML